MSWALAGQPGGEPRADGAGAALPWAEQEGLSQQVLAVAGGAWEGQQTSPGIKPDTTAVLCPALLCPTCGK